jgi:hypothetical protein
MTCTPERKPAKLKDFYMELPLKDSKSLRKFKISQSQG